MDEIEFEQSKHSGGTSTDKLDQRSVKRFRQYKGAIIAYQEGHMTLDCVVRNFSDYGAKIFVAGSVSPPDQFTLKIELDAIWADCEVIWRDGQNLGVKFLSEIQRTSKTRIQIIDNEKKLYVLKKN